MTLILAYFDFVRTQKGHKVITWSRTICPDLWVRCDKLSLIHEIDVFSPQAWDSCIISENWQVYNNIVLTFTMEIWGVLFWKKPVIVLCFTCRHLVNQVRRQFSDLESEFQSSIRNSGVSSKWRRYFFSMNIWIQ